jgi:hypothetical protein
MWLGPRQNESWPAEGRIGYLLAEMRVLVTAAAALVLLALVPAPVSAEEGEVYYDPDVALAQSLGYTLGAVGVGGLLLLAEPVFGATVLGLGLTIAPAMGHFYADNWVQGMLTTGARLILSGAAVVGLLGAAFPEKLDESADPEEWTRRRGAMLGIGLAGAVGTVALAVFDIATVKEAARRANTIGEQSRISFGVAAHSGGLQASIAASF